MSDRGVHVSLNNSLNSLTNCSFSLRQANASLENSVADFPRLNTVLNHERCYELVSASELRDAQFSLASQIEPHIKDLMRKAELAVGQLEQKHVTLNTKAQQAHQQQQKRDEAQKLQGKLDNLRREKESLASMLEAD